MKKKFFFSFFLIMFLLVSQSVKAEEYEETITGWETSSNSYSSAYAYELQIIEYDGKSDPVPIGKPILIYHPSIMGELRIHVSTALPGTVDALTSGSWNISQIVPDQDDPTTMGASMGNSDDPFFPGINDMADVPEVEVDALKGYEEGCNSGSSYACAMYQFYSHDGKPHTYNNRLYSTYSATCFAERDKTLKVKTKGECYGKTMPTIPIVLRFSTPARRVTYSNPSLSKYAATYSDTNLVESNIINGYVDNLVYSHGTSLSALSEFFNVPLTYANIDKYYVQILPVQRILGKLTDKGTYLEKSISRTLTEPDKYTASNWTYHADTMSCSCGKLDCGCGCSGSKVSCSKISTSNNCDATDGCSWGCSKDCNNCKCGDDYYDIDLSQFACGIKNVVYFYGRYATGVTHLVTVRSGIHAMRALNQCGEDRAKHCVLKEDGVTCLKDTNGKTVYKYYVDANGKIYNEPGSGRKEKFNYYIGPDKDNALVGTESVTPYKLYGNCYADNNGNAKGDQGIRHLYVENFISCGNTCTVITDKRSDEFLKCAENYCDAEVDVNRQGNPRNRKKECIIACGYKYGKSPTNTTDPYNNNNKDLESENSCNNQNVYKGQEKLVNATSSCNVDNNTNKYMPTTVASIVSCDSDYVTDFDGDDTKDTVFDMRKYTNIACIEKTSFEFTDTSKSKYVAGEGIDYKATQHGTKECTYKFNLEQWKFDYASIPSKDKDKRRDRLLYLYDMFNNGLNNGYKESDSSHYKADFSGTGAIGWEDRVYNQNKAMVTSKVNEVINNKLENGDAEELVDIKSKSIPAEYTISRDKITIIQKNSISTRSVNEYQSIDIVEKDKAFTKRCITTDGKANVYIADASNICHTVKKGADTVSIYAKNRYYTNLSATANKDFSDNLKKTGTSHNIVTSVVVGRETSSEENPYYQDTEVCKYKIEDKNEFGCYIVITPKEGTEKLGNDIYEGGEVNVKVRYYEDLGVDDGIADVSMKINVYKIDNKDKKVSRTIEAGSERDIALSTNKDSVEDFEITGTVTTKKGETKNCSKVIYLLKHTDCGVACRLDKMNDKLYDIVSIGRDTPNKYYMSLSTDMTRRYVAPSVVKDKVGEKEIERHYVRLTKELNSGEEKDEILFGYVERGACNNYCMTDKPTLPDCEKTYKPIETANIEKYCSVNYAKDINGYESPEDCVRRCSTKCPEDTRNEEVVEQYCKDAEDLGYGQGDEGKRRCMNVCYSCPTCGGPIYRTINNRNPFPYSKDSEEPYEKGNRIIGENWYGLTNYIKNDDEDMTSVTGENANTKVEYIIDLNPATIKEIRKNSSEYGETVYTDYIYDKKQTEKEVKAYKSKFIHTDFRDIFKSRSGNMLVDKMIED